MKMVILLCMYIDFIYVGDKENIYVPWGRAQI